MDSQQKLSWSAILTSYPFRLCSYGVLTAIVYQTLYWGIQNRGPSLMGSENGPVETAQLTLAIVACLSLFLAARWMPVGSACLIFAGALVGYAAARESDAFLERVLFEDADKWLVGLPLISLAIVHLFWERKQLLADAMWLLQQPAATLFVIAGVFLCGVCQSLDRPGMWLAVTDGAEGAIIKGLIEEYAELFAYLLLAFSGTEAVVMARQHYALAQHAVNPRAAKHRARYVPSAVGGPFEQPSLGILQREPVSPQWARD